jgi:cation transport regulator ChaC
VEYVLRLGEALREIDIRDEEVEALDFAVRQLVENQ